MPPQKITVSIKVSAPLSKTWTAFTDPAHITKWNFASEDWQCPAATNDLKPGGSFSSRMESKDGSMGFDFGGTYTEVTPNESFSYTMNGEDARKVTVSFKEEGGETTVTEVFDPETENPIEMQKAGWQAILENFKKHVETA